MNGVRRVLFFCLMTTVLPILLLIIPLYLRHSVYADVVYAVTESDILEISDGVSSIFCSSHTLKMNSTFNAFQMNHRPAITSFRKHIRLKKSMTLPDDTLEYWGFYLLKGATVSLSVCSRFEGARILVVKDDKNLRTCGMLEHNTNKAKVAGIMLADADKQVKITYETNAQLINSKENNNPDNIIAQKIKNKMKKLNNDTIKQNNIDKLTKTAMDFIINHSDKNNTGKSMRKVRHAKKLNKKYLLNNNNNNDNNKRENLKLLLNNPGIDNGAEENEYGTKYYQSHISHRYTRSNQQILNAPLLDHGIQHGGNALRNNTSEDDSSASSFEEGLLNCYKGNLLLQNPFNHSESCNGVHFLEYSDYMTTHHNVTNDGYYYYIFYSDNDIVSNDIHAVFDIYKPTFQYENVTKSCLNSTKCTFTLNILSNDRVIVEVPTRDGIEHEQDDISYLTSVCHPRMGIYIIFPIAILLFILSCAFI